MNTTLRRMMRITPVLVFALWLVAAQVSSAQDTGAGLNVTAVESVKAGSTIEVTATLIGPGGHPVEGQLIEFSLSVEFLSYFDDILLCAAETDDVGTARIEFTPKSEGDQTLIARVSAGAGEVVISERQLLVTSGGQLYRELSPVRVPGANVWMATGVLLAVWSVFILIALSIWQIARMGENIGDRADA